MLKLLVIFLLLLTSCVRNVPAPPITVEVFDKCSEMITNMSNANMLTIYESIKKFMETDWDQDELLTCLKAISDNSRLGFPERMEELEVDNKKLIDYFKEHDIQQHDFETKNEINLFLLLRTPNNLHSLNRSIMDHLAMGLEGFTQYNQGQIDELSFTLSRFNSIAENIYEKNPRDDYLKDILELNDYIQKLK